MGTEVADTFLALSPPGCYKLFWFVAALLRAVTMVENCHHTVFLVSLSPAFISCSVSQRVLCYPFILLSLSSQCSLGHEAMRGDLHSSEMLQPNWTESQSEMVLLLVPYSVCPRRRWDTQDCTDTVLGTGRIIHEKSPYFCFFLTWRATAPTSICGILVLLLLSGMGMKPGARLTTEIREWWKISLF